MNIQVNLVIIGFLFSSFSNVVWAASFEYEYCNLGWKHVSHKHSEASYQNKWCNIHNGIIEYENSDYTRVDCLTKSNAVEFDFSNKWAESIGQVLHYQKMTGRKGKVVLILENPNKEMVYYNRVKELGNIYNFEVEYITPAILETDEKGECNYPKCKCHRLKY